MIYKITIPIAILVLLTVALMIMINRKWDTISFFMFLHFDILSKSDDELEKLDAMDFDGFVTYR